MYIRQHRVIVFHLGRWLKAALAAGTTSVFVCLLLLPIASAGRENVPSGEEPDGVRLLGAGHAEEGRLAGVQGHVYGLVLSNGQFLRLRVRVENPDSNVQVTVFGPDSSRVDELSGPVCPFSLYFLPLVSGEYRFRLELLRSDNPPETYKIEVSELRDSTTEDEIRVAASQALVEVYRMKDQDSPDFRLRAVRRAEEAISLFRTAGDRRGEAEVFQVLSRGSFVAGDYQSAADYLQQARTLWHAMGEYGTEASILYSIANYLGRLGDSEKTLAALNDAVALERNMGDRWGEAMALDSLSDAYDSRGELQDALNAKLQALSVFRENKTRVDYEFTALADVGHIYEELGEPQKALDYHFQALRLARSQKRRDLEIPMLSVLAGAYAEVGDTGKALEYSNEALALAQGDRDSETWAQSKLGNLYLGQGEYDKALQLFNQILPYFHSKHARVFEATTLSGIGVAYHRQGKLPQALEVLDQALSIWHFNNRMRREILREIGSVYQDLGDSQRASNITGSLSQKPPLERSAGGGPVSL